MVKKRVWGGWLLAVCLWCLSVSAVYADEMWLDNGEILKGALVRVEQGQVTFDSNYIGTVTLAFAHVKGLSTDEPVTLSLQDGCMVTSRLVETDHGLGLAMVPGGVVRSLAWSEVLAIHPNQTTASPGKTVATQSKSTPAIPWAGSVDAGITSMHGNAQAQRYTGNISLKHKADKIKTVFTSDYARTAQKDRPTGHESITEDWWKTYSKLSYFFTSKNFSYVDGRYERDTVANLQRRIAVGLGAGYQLVESNEWNMSVDMGGASLREIYDTPADDTNKLSLQMGYNVDLKINDHLQIHHDLTCYRNGRKFSDYYLTTTAEIKSLISEKVFAKIKTIFNYDALPATDSVSTDVKTILGVGINF